MSRRFIFVLLPVLFWISELPAQVSLHDSVIFTPLVYATFGYQFPGGDFSKQFGSNSSIGGGFMLKTKTNWLFGVEGNFMFGQSVKNSDSLLKNISTKEGFVIDANGVYAEIVYYERGFNFLGKIGKVIPLLSPNPNCGFIVMAGAGYLQNKIRIHVIGNSAPQLWGDYLKGYDRLNGGFVLNGSLGYLYLSNTRLLNFYLGFDFMQTWTTPYRLRDFDTGKQDTRKLSSQLYTIKISWFIPLYRRAPKQFYLY
ncbi:MAG: hypothetical protein PHF97_03845 [Bacteroidales bacterium]|nr:hypothetical protein [Bacteroidales bacterium]MDD4602922.1 hypothetical protein [Bacteroidales bacterium]